MAEFIIANPNYAVFDNFIAQQYLSSYRNCHTVDIRKQYWPRQFAFTIQKDSQYFDSFNHHLSLMKERGTLDQIVAKYEINGQNCPEYSGKPLGFGQSITAFIALLIGNGIAFTLFV